MQYNIKFVKKYINNSIVNTSFRPFIEDFIDYVYNYKKLYDKRMKGTIFEKKYFLKPKILFVYNKLKLPDDCIKHINDYCKEREIKINNINCKYLRLTTKRNLAVHYALNHLYKKEKQEFAREKYLYPNRDYNEYIKKLKESLNWYKLILKNV
jgi:hypothetical protein